MWSKTSKWWLRTKMDNDNVCLSVIFFVLFESALLEATEDFDVDI
jgi:hypothetical protein